MKLSYDLWNGVRDEGGDIEISSEHPVVSHIRALDGNVRTLVVLERRGDTLMIGGGSDAHVCILTKEDGRIFNLVGSDHPTAGMLELKIGGQYGEYDPALAVEKEVALSVALHFIRTGDADPAYHWKSEA